MDNKYTSFELMEIFNIKKGSWYNLKKQLNLDLYAEKVFENKKPKFLYNEQAFELLKDKFSMCFTDNKFENKSTNDITIYQNQIIEIYKQRIEYLENENKRLLDIISVKEQKEIAKDIKYIGDSETMSFWDKLFHKFKR